MEKNCDGGASRKPAKKDGKIETLLFERSNEMEPIYQQGDDMWLPQLPALL